jgi:hypothetical protein
MGAAFDDHDRRWLSTLSLVDLTLHFSVPPPKALLQPDTHHTVVPEVVIRGPTPLIVAFSSNNLLTNSAQITHQPSNFTLWSQVLHNLLQVPQPVQWQSSQFSMVWPGTLKDSSKEERWWV